MEQGRRRRGGARRARDAQKEGLKQTPNGGRISGYPGGQFRPLGQADVARIHRGALRVLERVGMGMIGDFPPGARLLLDRGAWLNEQGRICFPASLIEDTLTLTCKRWTLSESMVLSSSKNAPAPGFVNSFSTSLAVVVLRIGIQ